MTEAPQQLDMPSGAKPQLPEEMTIHVMPSEFRAGKSPMSQSTPDSRLPTPTATPPQPKQVIPPPTAKASVVRKRLVSPVILIAGGLFFLAVLGLGAYLLLSVETSEVEVTEETEVAVEEESGVEESEESSDEVAEEESVEPVPGADSDSDGLTNIEEILFGSDPKNPDTDDDTYLDGNEVYHLYNPRADLAGGITDAGFAREFSADDLLFAVVYPSRWTVQLDDSTFVAKAPTGETISMESLDLDPAVDLKAWYLAQDSEATTDELSDILTKRGYAGITSPDKRTTYVSAGGTIFAITYDLGEVVEINFFITYQMMVNSFTVAAE